MVHCDAVGHDKAAGPPLFGGFDVIRIGGCHVGAAQAGRAFAAAAGTIRTAAVIATSRREGSMRFTWCLNGVTILKLRLR